MNRRRLIVGLGALIAAPAVIRTPGLLMPVRAMEPDGGYICIAAEWDGFQGYDITADFRRFCEDIEAMKEKMDAEIRGSVQYVERARPLKEWMRALERANAERFA